MERGDFMAGFPLYETLTLPAYLISAAIFYVPSSCSM